MISLRDHVSMSCRWNKLHEKHGVLNLSRNFNDCLANIRNPNHRGLFHKIELSKVPHITKFKFLTN